MTLMKEIKDDINRWRDIPFLGRKSQYCENDNNYSKQATDSMQSLSNYQWHFSQN